MNAGLAAFLALLAEPGAWVVTNEAPATICQELGPTCLIRTPREALVVRHGQAVTITPLLGADGVIAWNQALLRAAAGH